MRGKRDLSNPTFDRRRPRFGSNSRRTTTEKPKESKPAVIRFPKRNLLKPTTAPSRLVESTTRAIQGKTTTSPRSFVPSRSKFKRPNRVEQTTTTTTTESPRRRPLFTRPTVKPMFSRSRAVEAKKEENREVRGNDQQRENKLPVTFRRHQILSQIKAAKAEEEKVKVEEKVVEMKIPKEATTEVTAKAKDNEKNIVASEMKKVVKNEDTSYDEEEYIDDEDEVSDENYVEGERKVGQLTNESQVKSDTKENNPVSDLTSDAKNEKVIKLDNNIPLTTEGTTSKDKTGQKESPLLNGEDSYDTDEKDNIKSKAIFDEDEESYSDEYYDDEEDEDPEDDTADENSNGNINNPFNGDFTIDQKKSKSIILSQGNLNVNTNRRIDADVKVYNKGHGAEEDNYEEDSYEDDWDSEEDEDPDLDHQEEENINSRADNDGNNRKFVGGRRKTNNDMTELSPTRTTLVVKQDAEFGLNEGEEDDFEETNRAVRKTSLGRRRNQALGNAEKIKDGSGKLLYVKIVPEDTQGENPIETLRDKNLRRPASQGMEDDVDQLDETEDEESFEEEDPISRDGKSRNDQRSSSKAQVKTGVPSQKGSNNPKDLVIYKTNDGEVVEDGGLLVDEEDDYVDEYEENPSTQKSGIARKQNIGNKQIFFNQGSLLHLPIPLLKNGRSGISSDNVKGSDLSWDEDDESYSFEQDDDEYTIEDNGGFQDDVEEYDDQEEGHDHDSVATKGVEDDETYPDEEEEQFDERDEGKLKNVGIKTTTRFTTEDEEYYDEEEENSGQDVKSRDDEYDVMEEVDADDNKKRVAPVSNQRKDKGSKPPPLPYLRLVNPEIEEDFTTLAPSTPNLFRTSKPRQLSWKQASAPDPPPVILPRRTTVPPKQEVEQPSRGYRRGKESSSGKNDRRQDRNREGASKGRTTAAPEEQTSRPWRGRQRTSKESIQSDDVLATKRFLPSRGRFSLLESSEQNPSAIGRTGKNLAAKRPKLRLLPSTTSTPFTKTTNPTFPSTKSNQVSRPRLRPYTRKKNSDEVQFSESQLSKSTHNLPVNFQDEDEFLEKLWPNDTGQKRVNSGKNKSFKELSSSDRTDLSPQPTLPTTVDLSSATSPTSVMSSNTYFQLPMSTSMPPTPGSFSCSDLEMYIYHADAANPRLFHYCSPGFSRGQILDFRFSCVKGMSFSEEKQRCVRV